MLYDVLAGPFVEFPFLRRALVGALAWRGPHHHRRAA